MSDNQFIVTGYKQGGEHSDHNREFASLNEAMVLAWRWHNDPDFHRVVLKSRKITMSPWKVHTIVEPDHY